MSIVSFVFDGESIIDIGCDHGLLDVYLTINKNCLCSACDVNKDIINRAYSNFLKYDVLSKIDLFVGNGFSDLNVGNKTIVLAGMGTSTMLKILSVNKSNKIICQTNTDLYDLRAGVCGMGYYINREDIVFDNNRYYVTIEFLKGDSSYSYDELLLGPILLKNNSDLFNKYIKNLYDKNIKGYNKAKKFNNDLSFFDKFIGTLKKYI
jgi:tRNA (adenine22-N1)-methyltransferase